MSQHRTRRLHSSATRNADEASFSSGNRTANKPHRQTSYMRQIQILSRNNALFLHYMLTMPRVSLSPQLLSNWYTRLYLLSSCSWSLALHHRKPWTMKPRSRFLISWPPCIRYFSGAGSSRPIQWTGWERQTQSCNVDTTACTRRQSPKGTYVGMTRYIARLSIKQLAMPGATTAY